MFEVYEDVECTKPFTGARIMSKPCAIYKKVRIYVKYVGYYSDYFKFYTERHDFGVHRLLNGSVVELWVQLNYPKPTILKWKHIQ